MKPYRLAILTFAVFMSIAVHGQLFAPLGLGIEISSEMAIDFQPQMYVEGNILYVCTKQGLYSKDLSNNGSEWQLVGFEGIPILDYARNVGDILALRYNNNENREFLLLSHDDGKTYEDVTPDLFREQHIGWTNVLKSLAQHPNDPSTLLVSSSSMGLFQSSDFGQTWSQLTSIIPENIGYHPLNPQIIYESGEDNVFSPYINISYDGGKTWKVCYPYYPGDNCISRIAFHPLDPDKWIAGGWGAVYSSSDNAHTWNTQLFSGECSALWHFSVYDNENADIVYMAGEYDGYMKLMCSTDGGTTWNRPYMESIKTANSEHVFDMKQYRDKLLIYSQSDVYMVSKADLIEQTTSLSEELRAKSEEYGDAIYDLSGRKVNSQFPTFNSQFRKKGIYIQNGKKVVR